MAGREKEVSARRRGGGGERFRGEGVGKARPLDLGQLHLQVGM